MEPWQLCLGLSQLLAHMQEEAALNVVITVCGGGGSWPNLFSPPQAKEGAKGHTVMNGMMAVD